MGGFYEAILALMVVTAGVVLLTTALTFILVGTDQGPDVRKDTCGDVMDKILDDPVLSRGHLMLDQYALEREDWDELLGTVGGGIKVMLSFPDGSILVLHQQGEPTDGERESRSEAVNIYHHQGDVRAAILTVWAWT